MTDKNIIRGMEKFVSAPRTVNSPFDPYIEAVKLGYFYPRGLNYYRSERASFIGMPPLLLAHPINALGPWYKYSCASKPKAAGERLWMFSDFNVGVVVLKDRQGVEVTKGRMKPHWYRCMTDLWERRVRLPA